ncbi:heteromeric transposase endonuclease subunit TnsA [Aliarcobacter trophiarum LMG 25534]|uniref:Transposase endonuclease subunit TnsA n=1 Tax=Aliarcobacter trophiarum LMG 25534 TaxID=1032241 RepID=A0AAD0QID9_9BACT|nr:TnsA endonuclease N-terminal domain-containing protein [Aliarcobacter trophiarum]AXK48472.1 transposase endonuclease subunit TnsA [Aliarcobacter trophiarum LMG 25534]RXJ89997.1 heteromeric transposase endonuclease subunit TnsA [Aliarcobacter trophiarum LMG 25534]
MRISMKNRKIGYTYSSVSGHYAFRKEKSIAFESTLERDLLTILEFNSSVFDVTEQPITIEYINKNSREVTYTPDFLVLFNDPNELTNITSVSRKPLLIEVKPRDILIKKWNILKPKFQIATKYAKSNDMKFKIFDETRIRTPYLKRIQLLNRYKNMETEWWWKEWVFIGLEALGGHSTIDELVVFKFRGGVLDRKLATGVIYHLIANKILNADISQRLDFQTKIWINYEHPSYINFLEEK